MLACVLFDPELFALPRRLRQAFPRIRAEIDALPAAAWRHWPNQTDVYGEVRVAPLFLAWRPDLLPPIEQVELPIRAVCAGTWELLRHDAVTLVASRMEPGCRIRPHRDLDGPHHLRCHLGLRTAPGAWMRSGVERFEWREGECVVFDPRQEHEVANDSAVVRTILIVDFVPDAGERTAMVARGLSPPSLP
jgi:hypothetical protein